MLKFKKTKSQDYDRFDQSFVVHMIRDFFLMLLLVASIELLFRFFLVWNDFQTDRQHETRVAAEELASDVEKLMVNSGGPVAARTVYPMFKTNYERQGFFIAIEPSDVTLRSIEETFQFTPRGISSQFAEGDHHSFTVPLRAEEFCLSCHVYASPGDILGSITVRSYFSHDLNQWWSEVKLTGFIGLMKIVFHTIVLFLLLRIRMEPLLVLRGAVGQLAKAGSNLGVRALVKSHDEFGSLARDLNLFLDRMQDITHDLLGVLNRIHDLNQRLGQTQEKLNHRTLKIEKHFEKVLKVTAKGSNDSPVFSEEWVAALEASEALLKQTGETENGADLKRVLKTLMRMTTGARDYLTAVKSNYSGFTKNIKGTNDEIRTLSRIISEMAVVEEKMQAIAETGKTLVTRLNP